MHIADIKKNDVTNGHGVSVSVWFSGCEHRCPFCFNKETWDKNYGREITKEQLVEEVLEAIPANGVIRNLSLLGGDPLAPYNRGPAQYLIQEIRKVYPEIIITIWTGYQIGEIIDLLFTPVIREINYLIDGRFVQDKKDITLKWRGSSNQNIWKVCAKPDKGCYLARVD